MLDIADHAALSDLPRGEAAHVARLCADETLGRRLLDMGFVEGAEVELMHAAPLTRDPIAVRVDGALIAIRRAEAAAILVTKG